MKTKHALTCLSTLLMLTSYLPAEHVGLNTAPMSSEQVAMMKEMISKEVDAQQASHPAVYRGSKLLQNLNQATNSYYTVMDYHQLANVYADRQIIEIEDGSQWKIESADFYKVYEWTRQVDIYGNPLPITLAISPNYFKWFTEHNYYITNQATGSFVKATLIAGPFDHGPYTHWVEGFNRGQGQVYLENGSCWRVANEDLYLYDGWIAGQSIIVGVNNSWLSPYGSILINVNTNNFVRAKRF